MRTEAIRLNALQQWKQFARTCERAVRKKRGGERGGEGGRGKVDEGD